MSIGSWKSKGAQTMRKEKHISIINIQRNTSIVSLLATLLLALPLIAATLCGLSEREIFRLIENGRIHFVEAERVLVCPNSLPVKKGNYEN